MGSRDDKDSLGYKEIPRHDVTLTGGFWLLQTPVTQEQWEVVMENNPSHFKEKDLKNHGMLLTV